MIPSPALSTTRLPRRPAISLGCSYLLAIVMLGPLLGRSADASTAFIEHFGDDGNRMRDLAGLLVLLVAAAALLWTVVGARTASSAVAETLRDLTAMTGAVTAATLIVAAGLLLTVPVTTANR